MNFHSFSFFTTTAFKLLILPFFIYVLLYHSTIENFYIKVTISHWISLHYLKTKTKNRKFLKNRMINIWPINFLFTFLWCISHKSTDKVIKNSHNSTKSKLFCHINLCHRMLISFILLNFLQYFLHIRFIILKKIKSKTKHDRIINFWNMWEIFFTYFNVIKILNKMLYTTIMYLTFDHLFPLLSFELVHNSDLILKLP